jgi:hypothetical protein
MAIRHATAATNRIADLERQAKASLPDDARERDALWSWVPVPVREQLEIEIENATTENAVLAVRLRAEAELLLAQKRKADGLPPY